MTPDPSNPGQQAVTPPAAPVLSYATPLEYRPQAVHREGKFVVVPHGLDLPDRCVICNGPAHIRRPLVLSIHPDGLSYFARTLTTINVGFCRIHGGPPRHRFWARGSTWLVVAVTATGLNFIERCFDPDSLTIGYSFGIFALCMALICMATVLPPLICRRSNGRAAWLKGASESFLESLPREAR